ncbi:MAG: selenide, water dikinase SelD [Pseudomonadota bacterium]
MHPAPDLPLTRDIVLVGGGHAHALVLRAWGMDPLPGARLTVIDPGGTAAYSGMLPGFVAGHYTREELDIDLVRLARFAGARFVQGRACGIDRARRVVQIAEAPGIGYDLLSLDVGITSAMPSLEGFAEHGVPAKPLGPFAARWDAYRNGDGPACVAVLGGGVAGVELAMAMAHALRARNREATVTLLETEAILRAIGPAARTRMRTALEQQGVTVREGVRPVRVLAHGVELEGGRLIAADFVTGAAGARPHDWLKGTGLTDEAGFVPVDSRLRSRDPSIFAVGDCAEMTQTPRGKAGVYAVRQAPVLHANLSAAATGQGGLRPYTPQTDYLKLISLGGKAALGERFGLTFSGPWVWRWKDRIDRAFMTKLKDLPATPPSAPPWPRAAGTSPAEMLCGGCGSKVGAGALQAALGVDAPGDDAAMLEGGRVLSVDHLRAMVDDPAVMARIAAVHALGDIWAMGASPGAAVASVILPRQSPELAARDLARIMDAARTVFDAAGGRIVGGHSTQGAELTIGFTVTGTANHAIGLSGARAGDGLVLTGQIGSGTVMAGHMRGLARASEVLGAQAGMVRMKGRDAQLLAGAHAMTDVTGFGLAGHLRNIAAASGTAATLNVAAVPLMEGALRLAEGGVRSSIHAENRAGFTAPQDPRTALMFDPQTGGGLLAAHPEAETVAAQLRAAGIEAAVVGSVTEGPAGQVTFS